MCRGFSSWHSEIPMFEDRIEKIALLIAGLAIAAFIVTATLIVLVEPEATPILSSTQGQYLRVCISNQTGAIRSSIDCRDTETAMDLVRHFSDPAQ